jgi:monoamine oxidase
MATDGHRAAAQLDLAVVGAGVAGISIARSMQSARPEWSITVFERARRIGGRLRSVRVPDIEHPIELGGMRYLTSHRRVQGIIDEFAIPTRPFDARGGPERSFLRGHIGTGPADPEAGAAYDLPPDERGRSAGDLAREAFVRIVPEAETLDRGGWERLRREGRYRDRPLIDWSLSDVLATIRSPVGHRFVQDAFGYDSGLRPHNAADAIQFLLGGNDPTTEARVPVAGMTEIPGALATRFREGGGLVHLGRELQNLVAEAGQIRLRFADGTSVTARRVVLALPVSALQALAAESPVVDTAVHRRLYASVEGFHATKLYLWFDRPWWRSGESGVPGIRATTDLPNRKVFYVDDRPDAPAALLAAYTDGLDNATLVALADGTSNGAAVPVRMVDTVIGYLRAIHPGASIPSPSGSAFMHWGSDPREIGWTFWLPGSNSDEMMGLAVQPDAGLPVYIAGESFSRSQSWVEGAMETAEAVSARLLASSPG